MNKQLLICALFTILCYISACDYDVIPDESGSSTSSGMPVACFVTDKTICYAGDCSITFDATCSEPKTNIIAYKWDFDGDGVFFLEGETIITYIYENVGTYLAKLQIQLTDGTTVDTTKTIQVNNIISNFETSGNSFSQNCEIAFINTSLGAATYLWNFGDGNTTTKENPKHMYVNTGIYTISLTATLNGETHESKQSITITETEKFDLVLPNNGWNHFTDVVIASDGGYVITGYTDHIGNGKEDVYILKIDANGFIEWENYFGGSERDEAYAIANTPDGGYILVGTTNSYNENSDIYIVKTDSTGFLEWEKNYGRSAYDDVALDMIVDQDGNYVIVGVTEQYGIGEEGDIYLLKVNSTGENILEKAFDKSSLNFAFTISSAHDGGYIIGGAIEIEGSQNTDLYLIITDKNGVITGEQIRDIGSDGDSIIDIVKTTDNGYMLLCYSDQSYSSRLIKTDTLGNVIDSKIVSAKEFGILWSLTNTSEGGYAVIGEEGNLIVTDALGNTKLEKTFDGTDGDDDPWGIIATEDCGYIIVGSTYDSEGETDFYVIKTDSQGNSY